MAREALDAIIAFCYDPNEMKIPNSNHEYPEWRDKVLGKHYLYNLLHAYIEGGQDRKSRMEQFAENYQRDYSEVKLVLDHLGLEV